MTTAATSLQVSAGARWNASQAFKAQGETVQFQNVTELNDAIALTPIWYTNQQFIVLNEPLGTFHVWNGTHARNVVLPNGEEHLLDAATNVVLKFTGTPTGGSNGDLGYNPATGDSYKKISGTWMPNGVVPITADRILLPTDIGKLLQVNSSSLVTFSNPNNVAYPYARMTRIVNLGTGGIAFTASAYLIDTTSAAAVAQFTSAFLCAKDDGVLVREA